jgi:nitrogen-specific signal transduction histidine kinase
MAFGLLIEMLCVISQAENAAMSMLTCYLHGLLMVVFIIVIISAAFMERYLRINKNRLHQINQNFEKQSANFAVSYHDMRSPVSGICQMSRLIYNRLDDPELKRLQKLIIESAEKLSDRLECDNIFDSSSLV